MHWKSKLFLVLFHFYFLIFLLDEMCVFGMHWVALKVFLPMTRVPMYTITLIRVSKIKIKNIKKHWMKGRTIVCSSVLQCIETLEDALIKHRWTVGDCCGPLATAVDRSRLLWTVDECETRTTVDRWQVPWTVRKFWRYPNKTQTRLAQYHHKPS